MQDQAAPPSNLTIDPGVTDQTPTAEKPVAQPLNSFQLKQSNENVTARLMQTGLFPSKQHLLQAALMSLFGTLQQAMKRAEAPKKPTTEEIAEKFLAENRPLMEGLAAAEQAEQNAKGADGPLVSAGPQTNLQD